MGRTFIIKEVIEDQVEEKGCGCGTIIKGFLLIIIIGVLGLLLGL